MRAALAIGLAAAAPAAPAAAHAATLSASPAKPCYRAGESVTLAGSGYTPGRGVQVNSDGRVVGTATAKGAGDFGGLLTLGVPSGEQLKTYTAIDTSNTANQAAVRLRVSRLLVTVRPQSGRPGRLLRIGARGFTTGRTLYAHVVRGAYRRNVRIGRLRGACRKLAVRRRIFSRRTRSGTYVVQFDTRRHYSAATAVRYRFSVPVYPSASAAQSWMSG